MPPHESSSTDLLGTQLRWPTAALRSMTGRPAGLRADLSPAGSLLAAECFNAPMIATQWGMKSSRLARSCPHMLRVTARPWSLIVTSDLWGTPLRRPKNRLRPLTTSTARVSLSDSTLYPCTVLASITRASSYFGSSAGLGGISWVAARRASDMVGLPRWVGLAGHIVIRKRERTRN